MKDTHHNPHPPSPPSPARHSGLVPESPATDSSLPSSSPPVRHSGLVPESTASDSERSLDSATATPSRKHKTRLTDLLVARGLFTCPADAERAVLAGEVLSANALLTQPRALVDPSCELRLKTRNTYVSRGGNKLAGALADFSFNPAGLRCLDVGASTGGFTDCLLQHGAATVVAVDVAYGQFAWQLRNDGRVTVVERMNIREVDPRAIGAPFDLVVADVSFTPIRSLFSLFASLLSEDATLITLVKPQFELAREVLGAGGVITEPAAHIQALELVLEAAADNDLAPQALSFSPIKGPKGNIEFFLWARRAGIPATIDTADVVERAHALLG